MNKTITILDTSLRDGAQSEGIAFSLQDKANITKALDRIGIAIIEAGNPSANQKEADFFQSAQKIPLTHAQLCAFGSTRRKDVRADEDAACLALLTANTPWVSIFGKSCDYQVTDVLKTTLENNLLMIEDTCAFLKSHGRRVIFDAEHFFDGYLENPDYALACVAAAVSGGADVVCLCDTNGGSFPEDVEKTVQHVCAAFPRAEFGIHAHNDSDLAVAVTLSAVRAGATHIQGTFLGFGERCGNASLCSIIPNLQLKLGYSCIPDESMKLLSSTAREIAEIANISVRKNTPFIGASAFAHKAGMHTDAVLKVRRSFEHITPESVGNHRRFLVSDIAGKAALLERILKIFPDFDKNSPALGRIIQIIKEKEYRGYQFEGADSSMELIIRREINGIEPFFDLISYKVLDELPYDTGSATATIKLTVGGKLKITAADGDGPVNALDKSLREALTEFYPCLHEVHLIDYKVRVMEPKNATAAQVRVLITSADAESEWTTIGVANDIIEASWIALVDSIAYKLLKS
ncbi:MAG: citramalate synthase [Oscillospiraceae bacterium]|nr:citramalate synthase [Oscillospiraceae bacterium]